MKHTSAFDINRKATTIPPQVQDLAARERQLALTIYVDGPMTAKELKKKLSTDLTDSSIRSMLNRLCDKGVLWRKHRMASGSAKGRHSTYVYFPAILPESVQEEALRQLARDFFEDSLLMVAQTAIEILSAGGAVKDYAAGAANGREPRRTDARSASPAH